MNTLHLKYSVEIERTRSITKAAENLYMAQPNLSKAVKELEEAIGFTIFQRTSKGVVPTLKGVDFLAHARSILDEIEKIESLSNARGMNKQIFNISIPRGSYIAQGFTQFVAELDFNQEIEVNIQETNSMQTINNIVDGRYNLGIIRYQTMYENYFMDYLAEKQLNYDQIWEFEYLAVMSKNHALSSVPEVLFEDIVKYIEIAHGDTMVPYLNIQEPVKPKGDTAVKKRIYLYERCNQFDLLSTLPATYMWVSPIPEKYLKLYGLVQRKVLFPNNKFKDMLIYPRRYAFSGLDKKFIDKLYESKNEVSFKAYK
ncbi:MAG: LysR family transcriptional regulator [Spirochaetaceae bacterium]|nr:LysR family transcriptional regulator [Spirochaetaceae bacterium]